MHVNFKFKNLACLWRKIYAYWKHGWNSEGIIIIYLTKNCFESQSLNGVPVGFCGKHQKLFSILLWLSQNIYLIPKATSCHKNHRSEFNFFSQRRSPTVTVYVYTIKFLSRIWNLLSMWKLETFSEENILGAILQAMGNTTVKHKIHQLGGIFYTKYKVNRWTIRSDSDGSPVVAFFF